MGLGMAPGTRIFILRAVTFLSSDVAGEVGRDLFSLFGESPRDPAPRTIQDGRGCSPSEVCGFPQGNGSRDWLMKQEKSVNKKDLVWWRRVGLMVWPQKILRQAVSDTLSRHREDVSDVMLIGRTRILARFVQ